MREGDFSNITPQLLGDVVISVETAQKEAETAEIAFESRVIQLMVHGILHLLGYDHEISAQGAAEMEKKADEIQGRAAQPTSIEGSIKYDWKRKHIYISFGEPGDVFQRLDKIWTDILFGSKRDKDVNLIGFSRFSQYAMDY